MKKFFGSIVVLLSIAVTGYTQTPVTVKDSPALTALLRASKDSQSEQKAYDDALHQAKSSLDSDQKALTEQLTKLSKELHDKLALDKKYKGDLDQISTIETQLKNLGQDAQNKFSAKAGAISSQLNSDRILVQELVPIVRKENNLPDSVSFDDKTQTWSDAKKK